MFAQVVEKICYSLKFYLISSASKILAKLFKFSKSALKLISSNYYKSLLMIFITIFCQNFQNKNCANFFSNPWMFQILHVLKCFKNSIFLINTLKVFSKIYSLFSIDCKKCCIEFFLKLFYVFYFLKMLSIFSSFLIRIYINKADKTVLISGSYWLKVLLLVIWL